MFSEITKWLSRATIPMSVWSLGLVGPVNCEYSASWVNQLLVQSRLARWRESFGINTVQTIHNVSEQSALSELRNRNRVGSPPSVGHCHSPIGHACQQYWMLITNTSPSLSPVFTSIWRKPPFLKPLHLRYVVYLQRLHYLICFRSLTLENLLLMLRTTFWTDRKSVV